MPATRRPLAALLLAALTGLAGLGLTGCKDGTGLKDEGPATSHARPPHATAPWHATTPPHMKRPPRTKRPPGKEPGGLGKR